MFWKRFFREFFFFISFFIAVSITVGCGEKPPISFRRVIDEANHFSAQEIDSINTKLSTLSIKKEIFMVLRTSKQSISEQRISTYLDSLFKHEPTWHKLPKPNSFILILKKVSKFLRIPITTAKDRAVQITILKDPTFLGIRYGANARWRATLSQTLLGSEALKIQQKAARGEINTAVNEFLILFENSFPAPGDLSWYEKLAYNQFFYEIGHLVNDVTLNTWDFYNKHFLLPVLRIQLYLRKFLSWQIGASLLFVILSLFFLQTVLTLLDKVISLNTKLYMTYRFFLKIPAELGIGIPTVGSLILLSTGRLEEKFFVSNLLGIKEIEHFLPPEVFSVQTGLLLALALASFPLLKYVIAFAWVIPLACLSEVEQQEICQSNNYEDLMLLMFNLYDQDAPEWDHQKPFSSALDHFFIGCIKKYLKWTLIYSIMPFALSFYVTTRSFIQILIRARPSMKSYNKSKQVLNERLEASEYKLPRNNFPIEINEKTIGGLIGGLIFFFKSRRQEKQEKEVEKLLEEMRERSNRLSGI